MFEKFQPKEEIKLPRPKRSKVNFSDVAGLDKLKEKFREEIIYPMAHPKVSAIYRQTIGSGVLVYGPPGCGKTYMVKALAGEINWPFINASCGSLIARYSGQTENNIHLLFQKCAKYAKIKNQGLILFLDELDALGFRRDDMASGNAGYLRIVDTLLTELDEISSNQQVFVIGATNVPWRVDPAIKRPGRFDSNIFVPPPDGESREALFKYYSKGLPLASDFSPVHLVEKTENYSCADIKEVCDAAAEIPWKIAIKSKKMRRINMVDFFTAIEETPSSLIEWYDMVRKKGLDKTSESIFPELVKSVEDFFSENKPKNKSDMKGYV